MPHAWTWIRWGLHAMIAVLMSVVVLNALSAENGARWREVAAAALVVVVYATGITGLLGTDRRRGLIWLLLLVAAWLWLIWLVPEGVFLAFPLYFLAAHLLPGRWAVVGVAGLTVCAVLGFGMHRGFTFAVALGPSLGAVVALATVLGLRLVDRESARRGVLAERERLAREIHDTLVQGFSSINLLLGAAGERLPSDPENSDAVDLVHQARQVALDNLTEARRFVRALSPAALDGMPLPQALERTVADFDRASLQVDGEERPLAEPQENALVRIAQEALTNAHKHAGASTVRVTLTYLPDAVGLDVVDDGVGFDPARPGNGFGLSSMRRRAEDLAGRLDLESEPGAGTAVAVSIPTDRSAR